MRESKVGACPAIEAPSGNLYRQEAPRTSIRLDSCPTQRISWSCIYGVLLQEWKVLYFTLEKKYKTSPHYINDLHQN